VRRRRQLSLLIAIPLFKAVDTASSVYKFLLTGEKRVALGANLDVHFFASSTSVELIATTTLDVAFGVFRMDGFLHG